MKTTFSNEPMAQMAKANALLFKRMVELGCKQQLNALEKAHDSLLSSQQDLSHSLSEAMNSGDSASLTKMMASMPLWALRTQMRQGQKAMEYNSHAFEQFGQPMRDALTDWQKEVTVAMQAGNGAISGLASERSENP